MQTESNRLSACACLRMSVSVIVCSLWFYRTIKVTVCECCSWPDVAVTVNV